MSLSSIILKKRVEPSAKAPDVSPGMPSVIQEFRMRDKFRDFRKVAVISLGVAIITGSLLFVNLDKNKFSDFNNFLSGYNLPQTGSDNLQLFYSASSDISFKYDSQKIRLVEYADEIFVYDLFQPLTSGTIKYEQSTQEAAKVKYLDLYKNNQDFKLVSEQSLDHQIHLITLNYQKQIPLVDNTQRVFHLIYFSDFSEGTIVLDLEVPANYMSNLVQEEYSKLITTTSKGNSSAIAEIAILDKQVNVEFNKSKWIVSKQDNLEAELVNIEKSAAHTQEPTSPTFNIKVYQPDVTDFKQSFINEVLDNKIVEAHTNESLVEVVANNQSVTIDDLIFTYTSFIQKNGENREFIKEYYLTYLSASGVILEFSTSQEKGESRAKFADLISTIRIELLNNLPETGSNELLPNRAALIGRPATAHIFNRSCTEVKFSAQAELRSTLGRSYLLCSAGLGSGFFVNSEGYLVTNAHVAAPNPVDIIIQAVIFGYDPDGLYDDLRGEIETFIAEEYSAPGYLTQMSPNEYEQFITDTIIWVLAYIADNNWLDIANTEYTNFVQYNDILSFDSTNFELLNGDNHLATELVEAKAIDSLYRIVYEQSEGVESGITQPDLALLKVSAQNITEFPALVVATNPGSIGNAVYAIGYPGVSDNRTLFARSSENVSSVTTGTISAIKYNFDDTFRFIQIDASVSHGSSGGPLINPNGEVLGVITYLLNTQESGDFNVAVSAEEVHKLLANNNITNNPGELHHTISQAIAHYENEHYKSAQKIFEQLKKENPLIGDTFDELILSAKSKITAGEDKSPLFTIGNFNVSVNAFILSILFALSCISFLAIVAFVLFIRLFKLARNLRKRKNNSIPKETKIGQINKEEQLSLLKKTKAAFHEEHKQSSTVPFYYSDRAQEIYQDAKQDHANDSQADGEPNHLPQSN